jgi:hypothetical protein
MRFMTLVKGFERAGPPPQALMDAVAKLAEEATERGTLIEAGGLHPLATGARVRLSGGRITVTDGPFAEAKEVVGGYAVFEAASKQEMIEGVVRFMELHREHWPGWDGETEIRELTPAPPHSPKAGR